VLLNAHPLARAPHILNVSFEGLEGESLFAALPELVLSTGSACNSRSAEPSFVLRGLGRDTELAQSSLRFSLGRTTTEADIDTCCGPRRAASLSSRCRCRVAGPRSEAGGRRRRAAGRVVRFVVQVEAGRSPRRGCRRLPAPWPPAIRFAGSWSGLRACGRVRRR
jgi:hypothetical protein